MQDILTKDGVLMASDSEFLLQIFPAQPWKEVEEGTSAVLTCRHNVQGKDANDLNVQWFGPDGVAMTATWGTKFIYVRGDSVLLTLVGIAKASAGMYRCTAQYNGQEREATIDIRVYGKVQFTSPEKQSIINGTDDRVWCRFTKTPEHKSIRWMESLPGGVMKQLNETKYVPLYESQEPVGNYLLVRNVNLEDSKTFTCLVEFVNLGTSKILNVQVTVTVPPKLMPIHLDPTSPKEGDRLLLSCKANGIPAPTYMFYKGSKPLMEERSQTGEYTFESLKRTDEGMYTCNAQNDGGSQNETIRLDVKILPSFENTNNVTQREGSMLRLPCIATGDPVPSMFWRRKGSELDFLSKENSASDIHVEVVTDDPIRDGPTTLHRRTLYLVIPSLKSEHAGLYVCKADNQFGLKERTFKIDVEYKPNFNDQERTIFYGWLGSKTNLTCVTNGNPEPLITWHRDDKDLAREPGYVITVGQSGKSTRVISYLTPVVDAANLGSVFGEYTCRAANRFDTSHQLLSFKQAKTPGMVAIVVTSKATELELRISPPSNDGGQPILKYLVMYNVADAQDDPQSININRSPIDQPVKLTDLRPNTRYSIKVYAINSVGQGQEKRIVEKTDNLSEPDAVVLISDREGLTASSYTLAWKIPMTGGAKIINYVVQYSEILEIDTSSSAWKMVRVSPAWKSRVVGGQENTQVTLNNLKRETYYQVKIKAANRIGASDEATFMFKTGLGEGDESEEEEGAEGQEEEEAEGGEAEVSQSTAESVSSGMVVDKVAEGDESEEEEGAEGQEKEEAEGGEAEVSQSTAESVSSGMVVDKVAASPAGAAGCVRASVAGGMLLIVALTGAYLPPLL
ncbi:hypothetical protein ACOMHN_021276 [Nucella lapillus]